MADERAPREQRFERRMTDAEALMWNVEKDPWLNPNGGVLVILEGSVDMEEFERRISNAVFEVPRLRERVVSTLGRWSPPVWRPDAEFDLSFHIRRVALGSPGTMRQLLDLVVQLYQDPFDRSRPLWQFFIIDGLEGGRSALFWKIHHSITDGIGMGYLAEHHLQRVLRSEWPPRVDLDTVVAEAVEANRIDTERPPISTAIVNTAGHLARRQAGISRRLMGEMAMWGADPNRVVDLVSGVAKTVGQVRRQMYSGGREGEGASGSPLWRERSRHRHLEVFDIPLETASAAARKLGGSINDFFVTGAVNAVVAYHERAGTPVNMVNLSFVVSTRTDKAIGGNSFTPTRLQVPGGKLAPERRLAEVRDRMAAKRAEVSGQGMMASLAGIANLLPTSVVTRTARSQARRQDFATSNVRGPRAERYVSGAKVVAQYPFGPVAGTAFNLTTVSYNGQLGHGLFVDPIAVPDPARLRDDLIDAYNELIDVGTDKPRRSRTSAATPQPSPVA
jgi:diacylglycerol O-acyltransferase / wax synthase